MRAPLSWPILLGTLSLAVLRSRADAQPVGSEFQINTYTTYYQFVPAVASDARGNFVVVWDGFYSDGYGHGIVGKRYDSEGVPRGDEFQVNTSTVLDQRDPSVASDTLGNFVVVWESYVGGSSYEIRGQRYDSEGAQQGPEFRVNSYTTSYQVNPSIASDASGNFVVVWDSFGGQDGNGLGVFGQRYDNAGAARGAEFRVNSYTTGYQVSPSVAADASGNFVVVWGSSGGQDGSRMGIFGQRYDSGGVPRGAEFQVNSFTAGDQTGPSVAIDSNGNFVVAWHSDSQDGSGDGVFGQRYDSGGVAQGDEFQINSYTTDDQRFPSVGATGTNQFVVAWSSRYQDGDGEGVFGQRYDFTAGDAITVVSPNSNVKWRIGSVHSIQWTHTLGPDASFRIELDRDDDGNYEELIADAATADSASRGSFAWTVTGPPAVTARVRVSWADDPGVSDASDVTFQIRPAALDASEASR